MQRISRLIIAGLAFVLEAGAVFEVRSDEQFRYRYVSLLDAVPAGIDFFIPATVTDNGRVFGTAYACGPEACEPSVTVYDRGAMTVLHDGFANAANDRGTVAGGVILDFVDFNTRAALFDGGRVRLLPLLPGEVSSSVIRLTDSGIALVQAFVRIDEETIEERHYLYRNGRRIPLDFGEGQVLFLDVNNLGVIGGTSGGAFRLYPPDIKIPLEPLPTEPESWGLAINNSGAVLGYSFFSGGLERIGVWRDRTFQTYFTEGTAEFPTVSDRLLWNDRGLIVITRTTDGHSYLVPRPGTRLDLVNLTEGLADWSWVFDINNRGNMVGWAGSEPFIIDDVFLLQRVGGTEATAAPAASASRRAMSAAARADVRRSLELARILRDRAYGTTSKLE